MRDLSKYLVKEEEEGTRLDIFLVEKSPSLSRSGIQRLVKEGRIKVEGKRVKSNYRVKAGERVEVEIPPPSPLQVKPQDIPLDILFEDKDLVVVNKPAGMVVHPGAGHFSGTLVNALLHHCNDLSGVGGKERPGIVHRLDKDTSGVLVAAKNDQAHIFLSNQLKNRTMKREYLALVYGEIKEDRGIIDAPLGRHPRDRKKMAVTRGKVRKALTRFEVLERFEGYTLLKLRLETGRTHQIRVHLSFIGYPVVGDSQYGRKKHPFHLSGYALHAQTLGFAHPEGGNYMELKAPLPRDFQEVLNFLRG